MQISMAMIAAKFEHYSPQFSSSFDEARFIRYFKVIRKGQNNFKPDLLHLCKSSELPDTTSWLLPINFICITDSPLSEIHLQNPLLNMIVLPAGCDSMKLFNELQEIFTQHAKMTLYTVRLLDALAKGYTLQQLVEMGYEIIGNPFLIVDNSGRIMAITSTPEAEDDPIWHEYSTNGYASYDSFSYYLNEEKLTQKTNESRAPFFWKDPRIKYRRIIGKIETNCKQLGVIGVIEFNKPFQESDLELVSILCTAFSAEIQKDKFKQNERGLMYEGFIRDLLDGKIIDNNEISERKKSIGFNLKNTIHVLTIDIFRFDSTLFSLNTIRNMVEDMINDSKAIIYNEYIVVIITTSSKNIFDESVLPRIKEFLTKTNMCGGISRYFGKLEFLRNHYWQSLEALQIGKHFNESGTLFFYEDYAIKHIASLCTKHSNITMCCHPEIITLMGYDEKNHTSFTKTLYWYVVNLRNLTDAANANQLHRNTMIYRIEKIKDITGIDLNDNELLLHLYFSLKLLEYQKLIEL